MITIQVRHIVRQQAVLCFAIMSMILSFESCMQTSLPTAPSNRVLTVLARLSPDGNALSGITVDVAEERTNAQLGSMQTNTEGAAVLRLENIPVLGRNIVVRARRNGQEQRISVLLCNDTTVTLFFANQAPATANCARLGGTDSLRFRTSMLPASDSLIQNEPSGLRQYERCWSFVNSGNDTIRIALPLQAKANAPFQMTSISINGRQQSIQQSIQADSVVLPPSGTMSLCFAVSTLVAGDFTQELSLSLRCQTTGEQGTYRLRLRALVIARACDCSSSETSVSLSERVPIGLAQDLANTALYTNQLSCAVVVNVLGIRTSQSPQNPQQAEWSLLEPSVGMQAQALPPGGRLTARLRFSPRSIVSQTERLLLEIRPQGTQQVCTVAVRLNGLVCRNDCPILRTQSSSVGFVPLPAMPSGLQESLSTRLDGNVFVAVPELGMMASVVRTYSVMNPSTSCTVSEVNRHYQS